MIPYSKAASTMRGSEIRRLMALAADPSIISFAGGMPNNSLFPIADVDDIWNSMSEKVKQDAFQYSPTSGFPPLLKSLAEYLRSKKLPVDKSGLIITTGAQQAINLVAKVLIDPGDLIITEYPSFIGAVAAFKSYGAELRGVAMDGEGIIIGELEQALACAPRKPKMLYINTHFHNPAGITYSMARKQALIDVLTKRNLVLLEDDPYSELYFDNADASRMTPIAAMADANIPVCYTGSFAKIFGPGMRLGWLLGPREIVDKCELAKQSMDACSPAFTQALAHEYLARGKLAPYLAFVRTPYARRAKIMLDALQKNAPAGVSWTRPSGGFYVWVTMPESADATNVFNRAIAKGAAFVIGSAFDPEGKRNNCLRLAFSHTPEDRISEGVEIICQAMAAVLKAE
jgi:DNA-binding transcriptional MocR family regulator